MPTIRGHVMWSTNWRESCDSRDGVEQYRYSIPIAFGLGDGPIAEVGRVLANGRPFDAVGAGMRLHRGYSRQKPDPKIREVEGDDAPGYNGLAYVVFDDLDVTPFGNRVPDMDFEIIRE